LPTVSLTKAHDPLSDAEVLDAVAETVRLAGGLGGIVRRGSTVLIKPNLFAPIRAPATTDPRVVAAMVRLAQDAGAGRVLVADGRSISTFKFRSPQNTTRHVLQATGVGRAAEDAGAEVLCLEETQTVSVQIPGGRILRQAEAFRPFVEAGVVINIPTLKMHSMTLVTLGVKNLHGVLTDDWKYFAHRSDLPQKLVDILRIRRPEFTLIAGIHGLQSDHSDLAGAVDSGVLIASPDVVAADAVASAVMGLDPLEVETTRIADLDGLGVGRLDRLDITGVRIEQVRRPFKRPDVRLTGVFESLDMYVGGVCIGCEYYIRRGLDRLQEEGLLDRPDRLKVVCGVDPKVPDYLPPTVVIVGDCALASEGVKRLRASLYLRDEGILVPGCPPMEFRKRSAEVLRGAM
jgi:uncharacterized protein (DUF362 family)